MSKTSNIMTRIDADVKEQAENVLSQLGLSMSSAISVFLRQVALQKKIPFEVALPTKEMPLIYNELSDKELIAVVDEAIQSIRDGKGMTFEEGLEQLRTDGLL